MDVMLPPFLKSAEGFSAAAGGPTRQDTYSITVSIQDMATGNMINYGVWDKRSGGEVDSSDTKYQPGAMAPPVSLGGRKTVGNVTVSRLYRLGRDHDVYQKHVDAVGKAMMVVTEQPLTIEGVAYGRPIVWRGRLKRVTKPEADSEATGAGLIELEMTPEGYPTS